MRHAGDGEPADLLLSAVRTYWGERHGGARCVVAEAYGEDLRVVARTLMVAKAVCGLLSARLVVLAEPEWKRLAEAFGSTGDVRPQAPPTAVVTSRVDRAGVSDVPVVHVHGTGGLRAYAVFPDQGPVSYQDELPARIGAFFERHVWPRRQAIRPSAERAAWRSKSGYQIRTETERRQLRYYGCARLGLDPDRPTITVFGHEPGDRELFEATAAYAAASDAANWLFLDPVACDHPRIRSVTGSLTTNLLWSVTDVGVTFGDSDLPAYGIPVIQAGWSEGGACGATHVVRSPGELRRLLDEAIARHAKGDSLLGPEQRERARLWLWLRRCGADVPTQLLPHWAYGDDYARALAVNLANAERDGDPLYGAVRRLWDRRDPVLTRFDFQNLDVTFTPEGSPR
ncbi:hypothetical protein [Nonomuraea jiangxiensis]|uniref:Uncharacterized protein n=1 Tax=Nonomuraea jiangxiensis TaxID=633440 RepID=A0A1G9SYZ0_9ACTN|nr:hypothetical protein [Nonomuraea jiangxiensis]SDM40547.1 hypothetical protein SAMN05421869_1433 [Nonomuraea jiangxiensis]